LQASIPVSIVDKIAFKVVKLSDKSFPNSDYNAIFFKVETVDER